MYILYQDFLKKSNFKKGNLKNEIIGKRERTRTFNLQFWRLLPYLLGYSLIVELSIRFELMRTRSLRLTRPLQSTTMGTQHLGRKCWIRTTLLDPKSSVLPLHHIPEMVRQTGVDPVTLEGNGFTTLETRIELEIYEFENLDYLLWVQYVK